MVTHFSPSGYDVAQRRPCADLHDYLPFDDPAHMARLVEAWRPRLLVFVKFDCWPNQVLAATDAGVPVVLLAGSLQPDSARLHPVARPCSATSSTASPTWVSARPRTGAASSTTWACRAPVTVTGDTRVEQVILRYEAAPATGATAAAPAGPGRPAVLILGSTWPPDEKLWLPVLPELLRRHPDLRVVLTPHEPTAGAWPAWRGPAVAAGIPPCACPG